MSTPRPTRTLPDYSDIPKAHFPHRLQQTVMLGIEGQGEGAVNDPAANVRAEV